MQAELVGISFAIEAGSRGVRPLGHDYLGAPEQLPRDEVIARLKPLLEDAALMKVGQNPKYDKNVLKSMASNWTASRSTRCSKATCSTASVASRHARSRRATSGLETISFEDVAGKGAKQVTFNSVPVERATEYAAEDADYCVAAARSAVAETRRRAALAVGVRRHRDAAARRVVANGAHRRDGRRRVAARAERRAGAAHRGACSRGVL